MARENTAAEYPELPFRLGDELDGLGRVIRIEQEGPGVYYVAAKDPAGRSACRGGYVVRRNSPAIPRGKDVWGSLPQYPMLLSYALDGRTMDIESCAMSCINTGFSTACPCRSRAPSMTPRYTDGPPGVFWCPSTRPGGILCATRGCSTGCTGSRPTSAGNCWRSAIPSDRGPAGNGAGVGSAKPTMTGPAASIIPWVICFCGRHLCVALFELMQLHRELETNGMVDPAADERHLAGQSRLCRRL